MLAPQSRDMVTWFHPPGHTYQYVPCALEDDCPNAKSRTRANLSSDVLDLLRRVAYSIFDTGRKTGSSLAPWEQERVALVEPPCATIAKKECPSRQPIFSPRSAHIRDTSNRAQIDTTSRSSHYYGFQTPWGPVFWWLPSSVLARSLSNFRTLHFSPSANFCQYGLLTKNI